jgi:hypothetical protein
MYPFSNDKEKRDVVAAGPIARVMDMSNWAIPFVAPKDARLGDAAETYIKIQPVRLGSTRYSITGKNYDLPRHELRPRENTICRATAEYTASPTP